MDLGSLGRRSVIRDSTPSPLVLSDSAQIRWWPDCRSNSQVNTNRSPSSSQGMWLCGGICTSHSLEIIHELVILSLVTLGKSNKHPSYKSPNDRQGVNDKPRTLSYSRDSWSRQSCYTHPTPSLEPLWARGATLINGIIYLTSIFAQCVRQIVIQF